MSCTEQELWKLFGGYSSMDYAWVHLLTKAYLIVFHSEAEAQDAVWALDKSQFHDASLSVRIADEATLLGWPAPTRCAMGSAWMRRSVPTP